MTGEHRHHDDLREPYRRHISLDGYVSYNSPILPVKLPSDPFPTNVLSCWVRIWPLPNEITPVVLSAIQLLATLAVLLAVATAIPQKAWLTDHPKRLIVPPPFATTAAFAGPPGAPVP